MLARLWWKDVRQFWPIWLILVGAAAACQWFLLRYGGQDARHGWLLVAAVGWALLYAFAVSSAAFAGERENDTLAFLDMLPVSRKVLWGGKASFAVVTTVGLAVALAAMAWLYSVPMPVPPGQKSTPPGVAPSLAALAAVAVLLEVIGWGLLWSAVSSNAMVAAVLAIACSLFGLPLIRGVRVFGTEAVMAESAPWRLALAMATSAASVVVMTLGERPRRSWGDRLSRSIRVSPRDERKRERVRWRLLSPWVRVLIWETTREVWPVWWRLMAIGFGLPFFCLVVGIGAEWGLVALLNGLLAVVAGVSVFGAENRGRTHRFLAHHGARPGVVWAVKLAVWAAWLALPWSLLLFLAATIPGPLRRGEWPLYALIMMTGVAVGQLCGMVIRRGITAGLVAVIGVFAVGVPQLTLLSWQMLPWLVMLTVPLVLLAVSWAWSADWMLDRHGLARWVRLGVWLAVAFATVFAVHVASRVYEIPDVSPGFDVAAFERAAAVDPKDNAADLYREAARRLEALGRWRGAGGPGRPSGVAEPPGDGAAARREEKARVLGLVRRASTMPRCRFVPLDRVTDRDLRSLTLNDGLHGLTQLVADSARERRRAGDLAGAWDDLMAILRMARHLTGPVPVQEASVGLDLVERPALGEAMKWAADPRQTPERVRAALDAYQALPPMPQASETLRAESILVENTLNLPADDLAALGGEVFQRGAANEFEKLSAALRVAAMTSPWEVARARRAYRLFFRLITPLDAAEPEDRLPGNDGLSYRYAMRYRVGLRSYRAFVVSRLQQNTPLALWFLPEVDAFIESGERNEVSRRALVQILALRHWQLTHGGKLPESLGQLLQSGLLRELPADPYRHAQLANAGGPFGYLRSKGQSLLPLGQLDPYWGRPNDQERRPTNGDWLLYSVGPDERDDRASIDVDSRSGFGDLIFPLPESRTERD